MNNLQFLLQAKTHEYAHCYLDPPTCLLPWQPELFDLFLMLLL